MSFGGIPERLTDLCLIKESSIHRCRSASSSSRSLSLRLRGCADGKTTHRSCQPGQRAAANAEPKPTRTTPAHAAVPQPASETAKPASDDDPQKPAGGGEVVSLDRFRKK
jgi:hypothetical protein